MRNHDGWIRRLGAAASAGSLALILLACGGATAAAGTDGGTREGSTSAGGADGAVGCEPGGCGAGYVCCYSRGANNDPGARPPVCVADCNWSVGIYACRTNADCPSYKPTCGSVDGGISLCGD